MLKPLTEFNLQESLVAENNLSDYKLPQQIKEKLDESLKSYGYELNSYTSSAVTDKAKEGRAANFAVIPNQYFSYASKMFDFAAALFEYFKLFDLLREHSPKLVGSASEIQFAIESNQDMAAVFESNDDIVLFSKFIDKTDDTFRLGSKRLINDEGVPRGARDCFGSVILKQINMPDASASIFGRLVYDLCVNMDVFRILKQYDETASHPLDTNPRRVIYSEQVIRNFILGVVKFLFDKNQHEILFASLKYEFDSAGTQYAAIIEGDTEVYRLFRVSETPLTNEQLSSGQSLRYFENDFFYDGNYFYLTNQWADTNKIQPRSREFSAFSKCFNILYKCYRIEKIDNMYELRVFDNFDFKFLALSKPFLLLAGISGTGKSRFVRKQARSKDLFCSVAVRPDWHEPSDLLGYVSRLSGKPEYHATDVLSFIVKAWINACDLSETTNTKLVNINPTNMETYWLCLDEMNLAPVEQYFADYLSVIETREWNGDEYTCAPLLKAEIFSCLKDSELESLKNEFGLNGAQYEPLWNYFKKFGIPIPPNLIVAGTVNMDETTHGFSRKVIDRALTFDFGKFFPNDFDQYLEPTVHAKSFSFPTLSTVTKENLSVLAFDAGGVKTIQFCKDLNNILKDSAFELAFRALNELLISLVCINPKDESELQAVWDDFLMTKVLPRIEGDADKLSVIGKDESILEALTSFLDKTFSEIKTERIDFFREEDGRPVNIPCRSIAKIKWMQDRLSKATFTSFWP